MSERYFSQQPIAGSHAVLGGPEGHHLSRVMRAEPGQIIRLFDGSGAEFEARVEQVGRNEVELAVLSRHEIDREPAVALTLAVALPKGDRQRWLVEKCVELGVARLVPLVTQRSVAQPVEKALERLRRAVIEASKQCGRNRLMEINEPAAWGDCLSSQEYGTRLLAHPAGGRALKEIEIAGAAAASRPSVIAAIGPEGGLTDQEVATAREAGWQAVDLGQRILRVETAALLIAAWGSVAWS